MTKSTTMVTNNVFRSTRPFREGSSTMILFYLQHGALRSYVTDHTTMVTSRNKFRSTQFPRNLNRCLGLRAFLSTFWFLLCGGMYADLSFEVEHTIGIKSGTTIWLQHIFSFVLATSHYKKTGLSQRFQKRWDSPKKRWDENAGIAPKSAGIGSKFLSRRFFSRRFKPLGNECGYRVARPVPALFKSARKGIRPIPALLKALA